ncbi:MAG: hypothetical protein MI924_37280 [Chloroflexales bacterium]|nr:hypothetical protein [Chloroflexales bacterium]
MIARHLAHLDFLEEQMRSFDTQIEAMIQTSGMLPASPALLMPEPQAAAALGAHAADTPLAPMRPESALPALASAPADMCRWAAARTMCDAKDVLDRR